MQELQSQVLAWESHKKERYQKFSNFKLSEGEEGEPAAHLFR